MANVKRCKKDDRAFDAFQTTVANVTKGDWTTIHTLKVNRTISKETTHGSDGSYVSYETFVATKGQLVVDALMAGKTALGKPYTDLPQGHTVPWPYSHVWRLDG